jgi:hypothetical protein
MGGSTKNKDSMARGLQTGHACMFVKNSLTLKKANNNYMIAYAKIAILDSV